MRALIAVISIALAGCGSDGAGPALPDLSATPDLAVRACTTTCDVCASGTVCVTRGSGPGNFDATCLRPCQTKADCNAYGPECVDIEGAVPSGRYCADPLSPKTCGAACPVLGGECLCAGDVLVCPSGVRAVCGWSYEGCPRGCSTDPGVDGGIGYAHCRYP